MAYRDPLPIPLSDRFRIERRPAAPRPSLDTSSREFWLSLLLVVLAAVAGTLAGLVRAGRLPWPMP